MTSINPTLTAATTVQEMANKAANRHLGAVMTGMSVALLGTMLFRELSHVRQEQMREHDRRSMWPGDRRGAEREGGRPDPHPRRMG